MLPKKYREGLECIGSIDRIISYVLFLIDAPQKWRNAHIRGELKRREERGRLRNRWILMPFTLLRVWISSLNAQMRFIQHFILNTYLKEEGIKELYRRYEETKAQIDREDAQQPNGQNR